MTRRKVVWGEIQQLVESTDPARMAGVGTVEALQFCLDRAMTALYVAATMADDVPVEEFWVRFVDAQGNTRVEPNKWWKLEQALREEVSGLASDMTRLGIAERQVAVEEQKAAWVLAAIRAAAADAGLSNDQVRLLGEGIRTRLIEGPAVPADEVAA